MSLIWKKIDKWTALIFFALYSVLVSVVDQARMIWNPHTASIFHGIAIWLFLYPALPKTRLRYWGAMFVAAVAITIYPNGIFLIPFYFYLGYKLLLDYGSNKHRVALHNATSLLGSLVLVALPYIYFELKNGLPTLQAVFTPQASNTWARVVFIDDILGFINRGGVFLKSLYYLLIPEYFQGKFFLTRAVEVSIAFSMLLVLTLSVFRIPSVHKKFQELASVFGYFSLLIAMIPYLFFDGPIYSYRVLIFLPHLLIFVAFLLRQSIIFDVLPIKLVGIAFGLLLFVTNHTSNSIRADDYDRSYYQKYGQVKQLHDDIVQDLRERSIEIQNVGFRLITGTPDITNYEVTPLWYLFYTYDYYDVPINLLGNDTNRAVTIADKYEYAYVICFISEITVEECWESFSLSNKGAIPLGTLHNKWYTAFLVTKSKVTWDEP